MSHFNAHVSTWDDPQKVKMMKILAAKTIRIRSMWGKQTMSVSPSREYIAMETRVDDHFELRVVDLV